MPEMNFRKIYLKSFVVISLIIAVLITPHIQAQQDGDIRLINNTILEAYLSGSWGAVCDDFWSLANTHVACRELGFRRGLSYQHGIFSETRKYHLDDVICLGNESAIIECTYRFGDDCSNREQVWITCATNGCESFAPFADSVAITVKYYQGVQWYYISAEEFTNETAEVICRENTNRGVQSYTYQSRNSSSSTNIYPYRFNCTGNESSLCECEKSQASITSNLIVQIKCQSSEGSLKLVSGVNEHSGYVLIQHEETWKSICVSEDDSNLQLAFVTCKQLGYKGVYNYYYDNSLADTIDGFNYFKSKGRKISSWLTYPQCTGNEKFVTQCSRKWKDSVCNGFTLWVNCELHQLHDVELRSTTGLQYEGEPYILYNNKRSPLCIPDGIFNSALGDVICRTVGAPSYQSWRGIESNNAEFLNLQYTCFGNEENLASCFSSVLGKRRCEILYLKCNPPVNETPRISYGSTEVGLVEVYDRQKWGLSCMSNSDILEVPDARVICRQLGLSGTHSQTFDYAIKQPQNYWNSVFNCIGTESSLSERNCLQTTKYNSECPLPTNSAAKITCRPSKNQLRLNPSAKDINFFRVEYLTPERTWAPVCDKVPPNVEFCQKFGFNASNITESVKDNVHTYTQLECLSADVDNCSVKFRYDYISYYGCGSVLEVYCTNLTVPTIKPENIRVHVLSSTSVLLVWDYLYEITETDMWMVYRYDLTNYSSGSFDVNNLGRDHSRTSRRYQVFNELTPYSTHTLNLRLVNAVGIGPYGNVVKFTTYDTAPTGNYTNVTIHSIGVSHFTIKWEDLNMYKRNDLILGYYVCVRVSSSNNECDRANTERYTPGTTTPFQLRKTGLLPYTEYTVVIRAFNSKGYGPYSPSVFATTDAVSPEITQPVFYQNITIASIAGLESFSFQQECSSTGFPVPTVRWTSNTNVNIPGSVLTLRTEDLVLNTTNVFTCTATNLGGSDRKTVYIFVQIQLSAPAAPIADTVNATSIRIHWVEYNISADYIFSYAVCIRKIMDIGCTQTNHTTHTTIFVHNLEASTNYSISITVDAIFGTSLRSSSLNITTEDPEPVRPKITTPQQNIPIAITSVTIFDSFSLTQNCTSTGYPTPTITWTPNTNSTLNVTNDTLTLRPGDLNLEISTNIFTCTANNTVGRDSKSIRVTIDIEPYLPIPQPPTQQNISMNNVDIQWVEYLISVYIKCYEICVRSTTDTECIQTKYTRGTRYSIGSLDSSTTYYISIIANTVFGSSPASIPLNVTTNKPEPVRPYITTPQHNITITLWNVKEFQYFRLVKKCIATGIPAPSITWTSNTGRIFLVGNVLSVSVVHLRKNTEVDIFTCTAMNIVGRDIRQIRVVKSIQLPAPENPTVHNVSANSIAIKWVRYELVNCVLYYEICVGVPGEIGCKQRIRTQNTHKTIGGLQGSSQYNITIVVYTNFGTSPRSDTLFVTTDPEPVKPEITTPVKNVSFTINSISNLEYFTHTQLCNSTGYPTPTITWTSYTNSTLNVISDTLTIRSGDLNLEISTNIFTCIATNTGGRDSKSIRVTIDIEPYLPIPQPPTQLSIGINSVDIQWENYTSSVYIKSYEICVRSTNNTECIQTINTRDTRYSIGSLESSTTYYISIIANTVFGSSPASRPLNVTTNKPEPVRPYITTPQQDITITLSNVNELKSFRLILICIATGIPAPTITWTSNTGIIFPVSNVLSVSVVHLRKNTEVDIFTCTAMNIVGRDIRQIRVVKSIQLPAPENPNVHNVSANSMVIKWVRYELVNYVSYYEICVGIPGEIECRQRIKTHNMHYTIESLQASSQYNITIVAYTNFGTSPRSGALLVTTADQDPDPVGPEITTPLEDVPFTINSISNFELFLHTQFCNSTGYPTPTITWTSNTNSTLNVTSDTLTIRSGDLNLEISTNIFTCTATNTGGRDSKSIRVTIDIEPYLPIPQPPTQQSISINSVNIQWENYTSSVYIKSYEICVRSTTDTECIQTINTTSTEYSIRSLESATTYNIAIIVNTVFGRSPTSEALIITTNETELVRPEITTPQQNISHTIPSVSKFESFSFTQDCISTGVPTPTITWTSNSNSSALNVVDNKLSIRARHLKKTIEVNIFTCTATNSVGRDVKQILIMNTIELSIPEKPTNVSISINSIEIQWPDYYYIVDYVLYYEICVSITGGNGCEQRMKTTDTRFTIRNLKPGTQYSITIVVFTNFGTSSRSIPLEIITADVVAPTIIVPTQDQQITISSLSQLEMFTLTQECNATGVPEPSIEWTSNGAFYQSYSTLTLQVEDLKGIDMRFTCNASNYVGSDSKSIKIVTSIPVPPVLKLNVTRNDTRIKIQWSGEPQYREYNVFYQICLRIRNSSGDCIQNASSKETSYSFENLVDGILYSITIVTITSFGRSNESKALIVENYEKPVIHEPSQNLSINISTIVELKKFSMNQLCNSSGRPKPVNKWTSNTGYSSNDRLIIQPGNFSIDDVVNPYIFKCTAKNERGEDSRHILIRVDIDLTEEIEKLTNVTTEIFEKYTKIIQRNIQGVTHTYELSSVVREEVIERSARNLAILVQTILLAIDDIIQLELQPIAVGEETRTAMDTIAISSEKVRKALDKVEIVALSLLNRIPENETSSRLISSENITLVAENYVLPVEDDDMEKLIIPNATIAEEIDIKEKIQIPISVARSLSKTSKNFRIVTTIVKNNYKPKSEGSEKKVTLSSNIISVVIPGYNRTKMISLPEPVQFSIPVQVYDSLTQLQHCTYLNGSWWSTDGLTTNATDHNITFCDSDHFTSFAVFVTPREIPDDSLSQLASIVSYVLVSISFVVLIISIILFLLSGKNFFKVEANIVYFNYCVAMTLAFGLFLFGIESGKFHIIVCMLIAFLLHYIWLAVFVWTLCNGILIMYKLTIGILREHKIYPYLIVFGWSSPLIIPIITIAIKHENYVKPEQHCFITYEDGLIWSFIGPILIILLINLIILAFAAIRIGTTKFGTEKLEEKQALRKGVLSLLILSPLLGVPWLLLLLNVIISNPIVQWSFILINGLMGVFFFLAITLRNTEVKNMCAKLLKESSHQSTFFSDSKFSEKLSKKFKRPISKDCGEIVHSPVRPPSKGEYTLIYPVSEDSTSLKSPTSRGASRYDAPPLPRKLPKARRFSKDSSETEDHPCYDVQNNEKPVNPYTGDSDVLESKPESPNCEEFREENIILEFGKPPETKSPELSEKELNQNKDS